VSAGAVTPERLARPASPPKSDTLGDVLSERTNTFGFIRLVLASLVIVDHAFPLSGNGADPFWGYTHGQESLGGFAVAGFFVVSGFLISRSAMSVDFLGFLWRRILRIFPAFWLVLVVTVAVVAPFFYWLDHGSLAGYLTRGTPGPITYLTNNWNLTIGQYAVLDVFRTTPYGTEVNASVMNGSLWTLLCVWVRAVLAGWKYPSRPGVASRSGGRFACRIRACRSRRGASVGRCSRRARSTSCGCRC